jgi:hypothetical protein
MTDLRALLEGAKTIELVDWPHPDVPATLDRAGYLVVGHEPDGYKHYEVVVDPADAAAGRSFPLDDGAYLVCRPLGVLPDRIDIVNTFRPAEEQPDIVREALKIGARVIWLEPGQATSAEARKIAEDAGATFIDGVGIAETVRGLRNAEE